MAFRNKNGQMTGLSNQTAESYGYPTSGSMNQARGVTPQRAEAPQRQMQQAPAAHQAGGQQRQAGQSWMEQPNAINRGMQTQGAFAQMVPTKLSPGAASFLVSDANMKQAGAQSSGVMNRLDQLEKQQQSPMGFKNQQVIDPKLQSLISAYMKGTPGIQESRQGKGEFEGLEGFGDTAYQKGGTPAPGKAPPKPIPVAKDTPGTDPADGAAAPGQAPSGEAGTSAPEYEAQKKPEPRPAPDTQKPGSAPPPPDKTSDPYAISADDVTNAASVGASAPQKSSGIPEVDEAKGILRDALKRVEEGGELDQALMFQAKQMVQAQEASLQNVLAVQGGGGGAASLSPEMAAQQYKGAKALVAAKAQFEQIRLATEMSVAKTIGNLGLAETHLKQKNMMMAMQLYMEHDYAMDPETMKYAVGLASGEEGYTMEGFQKLLEEKPQPGKGGAGGSDWADDVKDWVSQGDDDISAWDVITAPVRAVPDFITWLFS